MPSTYEESQSAAQSTERIAIEHLELDDLRELMQSVTDTTTRLQQTHVALQQQVARLKGELAEANAQLRRSRSLAALGEMAAGIAHEIRNPLGSIQLYVQILSDELIDRPEQAQLCEKIDRAVTGLDAIVRDVLSFARDMKISPVRIETGELLRRAIEGCRVVLDAAGVKLSFASPEDCERIVVEADPCLMTQALSNVIRNAAEAMQQDPEDEASASAKSRPMVVQLGIERKNVRCADGSSSPRIVLAVEDTGPGIPSEVLPRMFNPFFTTRRTGTGLGLAIVHRIVDAHGGLVRVENVAGGGARVELCLPENSSPVQNRSNAAEAPRAEPILCDIETRHAVPLNGAPVENIR